MGNLVAFFRSGTATGLRNRITELEGLLRQALAREQRLQRHLAAQEQLVSKLLAGPGGHAPSPRTVAPLTEAAAVPGTDTDICPVCLEPPTDPLPLPCRHAVCENCLEDLKAAGITTCLLCRTALARLSAVQNRHQPTASGASRLRAASPSRAMDQEVDPAWDGYMIITAPPEHQDARGFHQVSWRTLADRFGLMAGHLRGSGDFLRVTRNEEQARRVWVRNRRTWPPPRIPYP